MEVASAVVHRHDARDETEAGLHVDGVDDRARIAGRPNGCRVVFARNFSGRRNARLETIVSNADDTVSARMA